MQQIVPRSNKSRLGWEIAFYCGIQWANRGRAYRSYSITLRREIRCYFWHTAESSQSLQTASTNIK